MALCVKRPLEAANVSWTTKDMAGTVMRMVSLCLGSV